MTAIAKTMSAIPCCPDMSPDNACDILDFHYRLNYPVRLLEISQVTIPVEVKLHFRLTRCPGPLALGNLLYTTTLLPGEKVKLFTSDRRTKFTFDSEFWGQLPQHAKLGRVVLHAADERFSVRHIFARFGKLQQPITCPCRWAWRCGGRCSWPWRLGQYERELRFQLPVHIPQ